MKAEVHGGFERAPHLQDLNAALDILTEGDLCSDFTTIGGQPPAAGRASRWVCCPTMWETGHRCGRCRMQLR